MTLNLRVTRTHGVVYPERVNADFALPINVPSRYLDAPSEDQKTWVAIWRTRWFDITVLVCALGALTSVLLLRPALINAISTLRWFRPAFLTFTLIFIGWYAQGQLSIVNLIALVQASIAHRSWLFFLYDPISTLLWLFVLVTLFIWGRGTFCGWLCPFGALQELIARGARWLNVPQWRMRVRHDRALKTVKFGVLGVILVLAVINPRLSDVAVEIEPFKTSITLLFVRSWIYVAYAVLLVILGAIVNKFFCRYICPLGGALALLGRVRRWDWITRRAECGSPCQTCRHRCEYQAIEPSGTIDYTECFQCMDCVAIYESDLVCAPRILAKRGRRAIAIRSVPQR
jgi:polyferredoxin